MATSTLAAATATAAAASATATPSAAAAGGIDTSAIFLLAFAGLFLVLCFCTYFAEGSWAAFRTGADTVGAPFYSLAAWRSPAAAKARLSLAQLDGFAPRWTPGAGAEVPGRAEGDCACCLQPLVAGADGLPQLDLRTLAACGHVFHAACLEAWICGAPPPERQDSAATEVPPETPAPPVTPENAPDGDAHTVVDMPTGDEHDLADPLPASPPADDARSAVASSSDSATAADVPAGDDTCCVAGDAVAMEALPKGPSGTCPICRAVYRAGV
ncbi:hypothetical protein DFJ74DRAFT_671484 [Hyaloraphidium curvatum]|nr:hypothetical protein DFJ74DRAFT_671484 [Hyaloraphidium curvatum]